MTERLEDILEDCKRGERLAQQQFYERCKGKMFVMCLRYANNREDAEDILQEGFIRVFRDLPQYRGEGNLEGWVRKVILNTALQYIRRQKGALKMMELDGLEYKLGDETPVFEEGESTTQGLIKLMQKLPPGFRTVLNLYVLEDYSHLQIAEELGISVGTSKSQLNRAKVFMKNLLEKNLTR